MLHVRFVSRPIFDVDVTDYCVPTCRLSSSLPHRPEMVVVVWLLHGAAFQGYGA